jgi:hypothetical protein
LGQSQLAQLHAGQSQPLVAVWFLEAAYAPRPKAETASKANIVKRNMIVPLSGVFIETSEPAPRRPGDMEKRTKRFRHCDVVDWIGVTELNSTAQHTQQIQANAYILGKWIDMPSRYGTGEVRMRRQRHGIHHRDRLAGKPSQFNCLAINHPQHGGDRSILMPARTR